MLRKMKTAALCLLAGACLLTASCTVSPEVTPEDPVQPSLKANVKTDTVERIDITYETILQATLVPVATVNLFFKDVSGPLQSLEVSVSDKITEGQVIAELDPVELQETIDRQDLQRQLWELREKRQSFSEKSYQIALDQAKDTYSYALELYNEDPSAANKEYRDRCKRAVELAELNQEDFKVNKQIFYKEYEDFKKSFELLKERLNNCALVSSGAGVVTYVTELTVEERVTAGTHIARFVPFEDMVLKTSSSSTVSLEGQDRISVIYEDKAYSAYVYTPEAGDAIWKTESASAIANSTYLAFYGDVPDIDMNSTVPVSIKIDKKNVLGVNKKCIRNVNGVKTVSLLQDGAYVQRIVTTGLISGDKIEIIDGLSQGDIVAVE